MRLFTFCVFCALIDAHATTLIAARKKGVVQFLAGFGIAADELELENVLTGAIFRVNYPLPIAAKNLTAFIMQDVNEQFRSSLDTEYFTTFRWTFYKALEALAMQFGYDGKACLLRSICEAVDVPFHPGHGLLSEILQIILTPSTSIDMMAGHKANDYISAEYLGRKGADCGVVYKECKSSIMEKYTWNYI